MKEQVIELIKERIEELKNYMEHMTDYEKGVARFIFNEYQHLIDLIELNID